MALPSAKRWLPRIAVYSLILLSLFAVAGYSYQVIAWHADAQRFPRPGTLVDVGGFRLNVYCAGLGSPTVVLESGLADSLDSWRRVAPEIAKFARVCAYDRAGYGYSDPGPMPRTSERIASELHLALRSAGEKPPYVLVGHSFGGFSVRVFNGKYSDEVSALVLVDATQEDQYRLLPRAWAEMGTATRRRARQQAFWAPLYIDLGIARLQLRLHGDEVPPVILQSKYIRALADEFENIEVSAEQARRAGNIDHKPLVVLTAGNVIDAALRVALSDVDQKAYADIWINTLQLRLAQLSKRGTRTLLPNSGHDIPADDPEAIVTAVRQVSTPLNQPQLVFALPWIRMRHSRKTTPYSDTLASSGRITREPLKCRGLRAPGGWSANFSEKARSRFPYENAHPHLTTPFFADWRMSFGGVGNDRWDFLTSTIRADGAAPLHLSD